MGGGLRQLGSQGFDDLAVLGADRGRVGLLEDGADQGGDPRLGGLGHPGEQVAVVVRAAPLPRGSGQDGGDHVHQVGVVVAGHQRDAGPATGGQAAQERQPSGAVFGAGHADAEDLAVPVSVDAGRDQAVRAGNRHNVTYGHFALLRLD